MTKDKSFGRNSETTEEKESLLFSNTFESKSEIPENSFPEDNLDSDDVKNPEMPSYNFCTFSGLNTDISLESSLNKP